MAAGLKSNVNQIDSDDEALKGNLRAWQVAPAIPPCFQREVWQRIEARDAERRNSPWLQIVRRFFAGLATPRYATATLSVAAIVGVGMARLQASDENARHWQSLQTRYVDSIDPIEHISTR